MKQIKFDEVMQKRKLSIQRGQLNARITKLARVELARELMLGKPWERYPLKYHYVKKTENNSAVYLIADVHFRNIRLDKEHVLDIFRNIQNDIQQNNYKSVVLCFLGDDIEGLIHRSTSNTRAVIPMRDYVNIVIECINQIKEVTEVYYVDMANHSQTRPGDTEASQLPDEDLGILAGQCLKYGLRPSIKFKHDDVLFFEYLNKTICIYHGHQDWAKVNKNKIIDTLMARNPLKKGQFPDVSCGGHLHQFMCNQLFRHKTMACLPAAKHWIGDYEKNKSFFSTNQITKLTFVADVPVFQLIEVKSLK